MAEIIKTEFRGQRNDTGAKFVGDDYFYLTENINQDDIVGFNKTLAPMELNKTSLGESIDGLIEYNYLNDENRLNTLNFICKIVIFCYFIITGFVLVVCFIGTIFTMLCIIYNIIS